MAFDVGSTAGASVHQEGFEILFILKCRLVHHCLLFQLLPQGGAVPGGLTHELAFHAPLVLEEKFTTPLLIQKDSAVTIFKVRLVENLVAEQIEGERFDNGRSKGLDEIQGETPSAILSRVQKSEGGIESSGMTERDHLVVNDGGSETDACVYRIEGRARGPPVEWKSGRQEPGPSTKIACCGGAFVPPEFINCGTGAKTGKNGVEPGKIGFDGSGVRSVRRQRLIGLHGEPGGSEQSAAGGEPLDDATLVVKFPADDPPTEQKSEVGIKGLLILLDAAQTVVVLCGKKVAKKPPLPGEKVNGDAALEKRGGGSAREANGFTGNHAINVPQWDFTKQFLWFSGFSGFPYFQAFGVQPDLKVGLVETDGGHGQFFEADMFLIRSRGPAAA